MVCPRRWQCAHCIGRCICGLTPCVGSRLSSSFLCSSVRCCSRPSLVALREMAPWDNLRLQACSTQYKSSAWNPSIRLRWLSHRWLRLWISLRPQISWPQHRVVRWETLGAYVYRTWLSFVFDFGIGRACRWKKPPIKCIASTFPVDHGHSEIHRWGPESLSAYFFQGIGQ